MPTILVTGGTGYIGSATVVKLLEAGNRVVVVDNLHNSTEESLRRVELICGQRPAFYELDIRDRQALGRVFEANDDIESVVHFAALKSVGESAEAPLEYYSANVHGSLVLLECMAQHGVRTIVFSSSATVYGDVTRFADSAMIPIPEECPTEPRNTYGRTKVMVEEMIRDHFEAQNRKGGKGAAEWNAALLRYFNPVGAHPSGIMGEDARGGALNLLPVLGRIATGKLKQLMVFGDDYETPDGTMIRDFIHVEDVAEGHVRALSYLKASKPGVRAWNLGSGSGTSVLEMRELFQKTSGREVPFTVAGRRAGDVTILTARPTRARNELGWQTHLSVQTACEDLWRWISNNPEGYEQAPPASLTDGLGKT